MKIAIIGTGNVAKSIGESVSKNNEVVYGSRNPEEAKQKIPGAKHNHDRRSRKNLPI